jgi:uncharacterized protein (TIGR02996 family)
MSPRNDELEALIAARPDQPDNYLVYADWLSGRGDPRGELIAVQHALSTGGGSSEALAARERDLLEKNERFLPGLPKEMVHVTWRWGFVTSVHFNNDEDWMVDDVDVEGIAKRFFDCPVALVLNKLAIGVMRWDHSDRDVPAILAVAAANPQGSRIRHVHVGDFGDSDVDNAMYSPGRLDFAQGLRGLESLVVHGHEHSFGNFDLPRLEKLVIETCGFTTAHLASLFAAKWPALKDVELWFGSERYGANVGVADLAPILAGTAFPAITRLGLCNAEFADALPAALATSRVLPRLRRLDLSKGTMGSVGARAIVEAAQAFEHLEEISLDDNFLADAELDDLRATELPIAEETQKEDDLSIPGEVHRYVSMAE